MWEMIAAAALNAASGIYGADQAADAQKDAAKKNAALQQQMLMMQLGLIEPQRQLGYQAMGDLSSLYGYTQPDYQSPTELMNPAAGSTGPVQVNGRAPSGNTFGAADPFGLFGGGHSRKFGGTINPLQGTVDLIGDKGKNAAKRDALLEEYLRTGVMPKGKHPKIARFIREIDRLHAGGYKYDPDAEANAAAAQPQNATNGSTARQPGNMSRFFTSPDYQFRQEQGTQALDRSAAARGGALSGNAVRAGAEYAGNLASSEYGNYVNRLLSMAGLGQTATAQAGNATTNYTQGVTNANTQQGDARASGVMGAANTIGNTVNNGMNLWALQQYLKPAPAPPTSAYGPYAGGYQFPK